MSRLVFCFFMLVVEARCALCATALTGVEWDWGAHPGAGTSVTNALDYFDAANWVGGQPANSSTVEATFTNGMPGVRYIKADSTVHVGNLYNRLGGTFSTNSSKRIMFVSDHPVVFNRGKDYGIPSPDGVVFYADVSWLNEWYPRGLVFCGDLATAPSEDYGTSEYSDLYLRLAIACGCPIEIRYDLFAKSSNPVRSNVGGFNASTINAGDLALVAPHGSDVDVVGQWSQEAGSPYVFRTGAAHVLCSGTIVRGAGIQPGTYVKRIFSAESIELSAPAESTIADNALTFEAFSPQVTQKPFTIYSAQANATHNLYFMKWREKDEFTVTIPKMEVTLDSITFQFTTKEGALPAKTVIETASTMNGKLKFENCHVQLSSTAFKTAADAQVSKASSVARLSVTNNISARIANFSKVAGTLVKEDAGTLTLDLTGGDDAYTGAIVAKGGDLVLSNAVDAASFAVSTLAVSNGATLHVPACGIVCSSFSAEPGAVVAGDGTVTVTTFSDSIMNVTCVGGAKVVFRDTSSGGDIFIDPPATNVPGNPAVWFDASKLDSFEYETVDGVNYVSQWNDVRGASVMSATLANASKKPELNISDGGKHNFVYFQQDSSTGAIADSYELVWDRQVSGIVCVFKVLDCGHNGGGQFLGNTTLWRATENRSYNNAIVYPYAAIQPLLDGSRFYVNGKQRSWRDGYAYAGAPSSGFEPSSFIPQVAELHLEGDTVSAKGFSAQENSAKGRNGNQDLYELIVYTNKLTEAERLAVTGYLMKKWLNADIDFEVVHDVETVDAVHAGQGLGVAAGTKMSANTIDGVGVFEKTGEGELFIADCHAAGTAVDVKEGRLSVVSELATKSTLPEGAVLHLDAADSTTYLGTHENGGNRYVTEWGDARGAGYGSVVAQSPTATTSTTHPKVVPNKQNGLPMIDFGTWGTGKTSHNNMTGGLMRVSTFFTVQNSENGGGYLFGDTDVNCYSAAADGHHGLIRYPSSSVGNAVIYSTYGTAAVCCFGPGATRVRLNGTPVTDTSTGYTGGTDLLTIQTYEQLIGNSISFGNCNNAVYGGGKMVGELIYYDRRLTDGETDRVEAYLNKKWFGVDTPAFTPCCLAAATVRSGATLVVGGVGPLVVGSCGGDGTIEGSLAFADGATWAVTADAGGVSSALSVTGTLDITGLERVVVSGSTKPVAGAYPLVAAAGIEGDLAGVEVVADLAADGYAARLRKRGSSLFLEILPSGMTLIVR